MDFDLDVINMKGIMHEVDRHSRILGRQEELTGN